MQGIWHDVRYALRQMRRSPGFAVTAVLTLGLGLGTATAMLAIVDSVLLRPVALPHASQLVSMTRNLKGNPLQDIPFKDIKELQDHARGFAALGAYESLPGPVKTSAGTRVALVVQASAHFFAVPDVPARFGRVLGAQDAHQPVAVVSDAFWRETLHADPHALGSTITIEGKLRTIVGVLPAHFDLAQHISGSVVYVPLDLDSSGKDEHQFDSAQVVGRLRDGVTPAGALAEARPIYAHTSRPEEKDRGQLLLLPYREVMTGDEKPALMALLGACAMLLLISCANSANLQIARALGRVGEMHMRSALGASRARLLRQIVTESVVVSLLGAGLGFLLAAGAVHAIRTVYGQQFARFDELRFHPEVFCLCTLLAVLAGVLAALAPAFQTLRAQGRLHATVTTKVTRRSRLSGWLIAGEIALTCILLTATGLLLQSFRALEHTPMGIDPQHVTQITLLPTDPHETTQQLKQTFERLLQALGALPGVEAATMQTSLPFSQFTLSMNSTIHLFGRPASKDDESDVSLVSTGYNRTLGIPMRAGRPLQPADDGSASPVCLVNEAFIRHYFPAHTPLGQIVEFTAASKDTDDRFLKKPVTIVGVVPDEITGRSLADRPRPTMFLNFLQYPAEGAQARFIFGIAPQFAVRSLLPEAVLTREIRGALKQAAPDLAEMQIAEMSAGIQNSLRNQQLALRLTGGFGALALLLAAVGVYGVLAYTVAQRTREIGIRLALGSSRSAAMTLVMRQAAVMVAAGLAVGLLAEWPTSRALHSFLFGVGAFDPLTLAFVILLLLLVCAFAAARPAWQATRIDPTEALRAE